MEPKELNIDDETKGLGPNAGITNVTDCPCK